MAVASGAPGCVLAGLWADRFGKARVAGAAMLASAACALSAGLVFGRPFAALLAFGAVWGFAVVADSAQFSALVADYCPPTEVGTALTLQTCSGFLLTLLTIRLVPAAAATLGWPWVFVLLAPGPILGAWAMRALAADRPADGVSPPGDPGHAAILPTDDHHEGREGHEEGTPGQAAARGVTAFVTS